MNINKIKSLFLSILAVSSILYTSCSKGYVATQPTQIEVVRPVRPSTNHIWINGNWMWMRRSHNYQWRNGYWAAPYRNKGYNQGYWKSGPRGHHWVKGRWH